MVKPIVNQVFKNSRSGRRMPRVLINGQYWKPKLRKQTQKVVLSKILGVIGALAP